MHLDGRRFLVYQDVAPKSTTGASARRSLIVVTNWFTALRQKLGEGAVP